MDSNHDHPTTTRTPNGPPTGVPKRKPVPGAIAPSSPPAPPSSTTDSVEKAPEPIVTVTAATTAAALSTHRTGRQWWKWSQFSILLTGKKKRIVLTAIVAGVCLLSLVIGLAVGLTRRHGKGSSNLPLPTSNGGPYQGDLTYYDPGLGSCGITSSASDRVCAVSHVLFDAALTSSNPNENPLCGLKLRIRRGEKSVDVEIVDRCPGCNVNDLDVSPAVFEDLGDLAEGRVLVDWSWLEWSPVATI